MHAEFDAPSPPSAAHALLTIVLPRSTVYLCMFRAAMKEAVPLVSRSGTKCFRTNSSGSLRAEGSSSPVLSAIVIVPTTSSLVPGKGDGGGRRGREEGEKRRMEGRRWEWREEEEGGGRGRREGEREGRRRGEVE